MHDPEQESRRQEEQHAEGLSPLNCLGMDLLFFPTSWSHGEASSQGTITEGKP